MIPPTPPKWVVPTLGIITLIIGIFAVFFTHRPVSPPPPRSSPVSATPAVVSQPGQVAITASGFFPASISVKLGTAVTWTNRDKTPHQVISDPHPTHTQLPLLDSGALSPGDAYTYTFEAVGTFGYHDEFHPLQIRATVIVTP